MTDGGGGTMARIMNGWRPFARRSLQFPVASCAGHNRLFKRKGSREPKELLYERRFTDDSFLLSSRSTVRLSSIAHGMLTPRNGRGCPRRSWGE